jgi:hypothetical protein
MIGQSMGSMLLDVINPIVELYPDLKPSQLDKRFPNPLAHESARNLPANIGNEDKCDLVGAIAARYVQTTV